MIDFGNDGSTLSPLFLKKENYSEIWKFGQKKKGLKGVLKKYISLPLHRRLLHPARQLHNNGMESLLTPQYFELLHL